MGFKCQVTPRATFRDYRCPFDTLIPGNRGDIVPGGRRNWLGAESGSEQGAGSSGTKWGVRAMKSLDAEEEPDRDGELETRGSGARSPQLQWSLLRVGTSMQPGGFSPSRPGWGLTPAQGSPGPRQPQEVTAAGLRPGWTRFGNRKQRELRSQGAGLTGPRGKGGPVGK